MKAAISVKSPFSHSALFGFIISPLDVHWMASAWREGAEAQSLRMTVNNETKRYPLQASRGKD